MSTTQLSGSHQVHARLSPSSSKTWSNCTAAPAFQEANSHRVRKDDSSEFSREGTEAHDWAADVLLNKITVADVPEDFRPHVKSYVEHCLGLVPTGVSYQVEVSVPLWYQTDQKGTCDFAIVTDDLVVVRDLKYGQGVLVTSEENPQLAIYAYSFIRALEDVYDFHPATLIDIAAFQPRHREAAEAKPWIVTLAELQQFCSDIEEAAAIANSGVELVRQAPVKGNVSTSEVLELAPVLTFAPKDGDDGACRWCKCKAFCDARFAAASEGVSLPDLDAAELLSLLPDLTRAEEKLPVAERIAQRVNTPLSDGQLVKWFERGKAIQKFFADVEEYLETRVEAGEHIPGLKLVLGREGNRAWRNEEEAETFLRNQGLKEKERFKFVLQSPTQIELLLKEKLESSTRTKNRFEELISRSPAKPVLALEGDKRQALTPNVGMLPDLVEIDSFEI